MQEEQIKKGRNEEKKMVEGKMKRKSVRKHEDPECGGKTKKKCRRHAKKNKKTERNQREGSDGGQAKKRKRKKRKYIRRRREN
jgi:hypothetical protein